MTDGDAYSERTRQRFGARGEVFRETRKETDLDDMHEVTDEVILSFCPACGAAMPDPSNARRCVNCDDLVCSECSVEAFQAKTMCRDCLTAAVPKEQWLAVFLVKQGVLPTEPVTEPGDDGVVEREDARVASLRDAGLIDPDGALTVRGREVYALGMELYREDPDVQEFVHDVRVADVAARR